MRKIAIISLLLLSFSVSAGYDDELLTPEDQEELNDIVKNERNIIVHLEAQLQQEQRLESTYKSIYNQQQLNNYQNRLLQYDILDSLNRRHSFEIRRHIEAESLLQSKQQN